MARTTFSADGEFEFTPNTPSMRIKSQGTWGSGTLKIQEDINGTWEDLPSASWIADAMSSLDVATGRNHKAVLSGATSPSLVFEAVDLK